jgi:valyl-tRNA synthetase
MRLDEAVLSIHQAFEGYEFNQVTAKLYEFFWASYCDWYLEASKASLHGSSDSAKSVTLAVMDHVLNVTLRLLHPIMPFITEELWQALGFGEGETDGRKSSIQFAAWPIALSDSEANRLGLNPEILKFVEQKYEAVTAGRHLRASYRIPTSRRIRFAFMKSNGWTPDAYEVDVLKTLLNAERLDVIDTRPSGAASSVTPLGVIYLPLEGLVDVDAEKKRLQTQIAKLEQERASVEQKLQDEGFVSRAAPEKIAAHRGRAAQIQSDVGKIQEQIRTLTGLK